MLTTAARLLKFISMYSKSRIHNIWGNDTWRVVLHSISLVGLIYNNTIQTEHFTF